MKIKNVVLALKNPALHRANSSLEPMSLPRLRTTLPWGCQDRAQHWSVVMMTLSGSAPGDNAVAIFYDPSMKLILETVEMILQVIMFIDPAKQEVVGSIALTEAGSSPRPLSGEERMQTQPAPSTASLRLPDTSHHGARLRLIETRRPRFLINSQKDWSIDRKLHVRAFSQEGIVDVHSGTEVAKAGGRSCRCLCRSGAEQPEAFTSFACS